MASNMSTATQGGPDKPDKGVLYRKTAEDPVDRSHLWARCTVRK